MEPLAGSIDLAYMQRERIVPANAPAIIGVPASENGSKSHLMICRDCGQAMDLRDFQAVLHHEMPGHNPLPSTIARRLSAISEALKKVLRKDAFTHVP